MNLTEIKQQAEEKIKQAKSEKALEAVRIEYLGRKGELTAILRSLANLSIEEKRTLGAQANALRAHLEMMINERLGIVCGNSNLNDVDITIPAASPRLGHLHPLTLVENDIKRIFEGMNFNVVEGPEVETEHYNFDALNIPAYHPARDMWDTFWLRSNQNVSTTDKEQLTTDHRDRLLLRTHTSPMQIRYMETHKPPLRIIVPGRVFRYEAIDASHQINFHQVEGLMVDEHVSLANFKYVITEFLKQLFGDTVELRLRPSYFPFVEPGLEIDIKFPRHSASSPRESASPWLEVMGAGMVHQNVFKAVGYDPKKVSGFAFGLGLERMAMIKYGIPDIRMFYENDPRFLKQF